MFQTNSASFLRMFLLFCCWKQCELVSFELGVRCWSRANFEGAPATGLLRLVQSFSFRLSFYPTYSFIKQNKFQNQLCSKTKQPKHRRSQGFLLGRGNHKSHAMTLSETFRRGTFYGTKISKKEWPVALVWFTKVNGENVSIRRCVDRLSKIV